MFICVPSKNIYISEADLPLFERAAGLAGSLSAALASGMRLYLAQQESQRKKNDMHTIELKVDDGPLTTIKRFTGRRLLQWQQETELRTETFRVYQTAKGQFAVYQREDPNWATLSHPDEHDPIWDNPETWNTNWWRRGQRMLLVFADLSAMQGELPADLIEAISAAESRPAVEDLDI